MRLGLPWLLAALLLACGGKTETYGVECPDGAKASIQTRKVTRTITCRRKNVRHGPTVTMRKSDGWIESRSEYKDGKKHGRDRAWSGKDRLKHDIGYADGQLHGKVRIWSHTGELIAESHWKLGKRHGRFTVFRDRKKSSEATFDDGRLVGDWILYGKDRKWVRTYDQRGRLIAYKGKNVSPPQKIRFADGDVFDWDSCALDDPSNVRGFKLSLCGELIELTQRCSPGPELETCRKRVIDGYAKFHKKDLALPPVRLSGGDQLTLSQCDKGGYADACRTLLYDHAKCAVDNADGTPATKACRKKAIKAYESGLPR